MKRTRQPTPPGEMLDEEFLKPLEMTASDLASRMRVRRRCVAEIVAGNREITPDIAIRLGAVFAMSPEFWLNLQNRYSLWRCRKKFRKDYEKIQAIKTART